MTVFDFDELCLSRARGLYVCYNKESQEQKDAQAQQPAFNKQLQSIYQTQFAENQSILKALTPQLQAMAANPQGFGATEYHALQSQIINDTGAQYSNMAKGVAQDFATSNEAGLPSGVQAQLQANIAAGAAGQVSNASNNLAIQNEQLKQQQQQFAMGTLEGQQGSIGSQMGTTGNQVGSGLQNQFQNATTVYNQGSLWKNILGGIVGAGLNVATGGLSSLMTGGSFMSGA